MDLATSVKHGKLFDLEHIGNCNVLVGCPDISKYDRLSRRVSTSCNGARRCWHMQYYPVHPAGKAAVLLDCQPRASLVQMPVDKKASTGKNRVRLKASEYIARTNHKIDESYRKGGEEIEPG
jgi:hypothetical protein